MMERTPEFRQAIDILERGLEESLQQYLQEELHLPPTDDLPDIEQRVADLWDVRKDEGEINTMTKKAYNTRPDKIIYQEKDPVFAAMIDEFETAIEQSFKNSSLIQQMHSTENHVYAERDLAFARAIDLLEEGIDQAIAELNMELNLDSLIKERDPQFAQIIDEIEASIIDITNHYLDRQAS
ncbi:MAG TPA: hypothetical protein GX404_07835 [Syntrophomonadaceae bacterium]|nr:hypothetical protein [Syntrophomonadaceae bacterium]